MTTAPVGKGGGDDFVLESIGIGVGEFGDSIGIGVDSADSIGEGGLDGSAVDPTLTLCGKFV